MPQNNKKKPQGGTIREHEIQIFFLAIKIKVLLISVSKNQSMFGNSVTAAAIERL